MIGGILEFYDLTIYGFLASTLSLLFFSFDNPFLSLILGYSLFSIGFFFRPLGSVLFGYIGDKYGRKTALCSSIITMACATTMIGLLPTYETIGIFAACALVVARVAQGLSAGGEYSGAIIFAIEHTKASSRGFAGSLVVSGCMGGVFLGSLSSFVFTSSLMPSWGWRIPFLVGGAISLIGFYIRRNLDETPQFRNLKQHENKKTPLLDGIKKNPLLCFSTFGIAGASGIILYVISVYMPLHLKQIGNVSNNISRIFPVVCTFIMMISIPFFGFLSDNMRRDTLMKIGYLTLSVIIFPAFSLINTGDSTSILMAAVILATASTIFMGPMNTYIVELFSVSQRYSCSAVFYSLGMGILGGTAPAVGVILSSYDKGYWLLATYLICGCLLGFISVMISASRKVQRPNSLLLEQIVDA